MRCHARTYAKLITRTIRVSVLAGVLAIHMMHKLFIVVYSMGIIGDLVPSGIYFS